MQKRYAKQKICERNHCLRPYISESSLEKNTSEINNSHIKNSQNSNLNTSNSSIITIDLANNSIEQATLLNFVENFSTSSPNFCVPSYQRYVPSMSGSINRPIRIDIIRARNQAWQRHSKEALEGLLERVWLNYWTNAGGRD